MKLKKTIAPIAITAIVCLYGVFLLYLSFSLDESIFAKIFLGMAALGICFGAIHVLVERIKEIRKGETDDLGKY